MECKLIDIFSFGSGGGSANIAVCEVIKFHVAEDIFKDGIIQPDLIDLVARMSANFYCRASDKAIFEVEKPTVKKGIGYDMIPSFMKMSHIYSANNLAKFGNIEVIPTSENVDDFIKEIEESNVKPLELSEEAFFRYKRHNKYYNMLKVVLQLSKENNPKINTYLELTAKCALENNDIGFAWKTALFSGRI
jgi:hypothetical protein